MDDVVSSQQDEIWLGFERQVNAGLQVIEMIERRAHMQIRKHGHFKSLTRRGPGRNNQVVGFIMQAGRLPPKRPQTYSQKWYEENRELKWLSKNGQRKKSVNNVLVSGFSLKPSKNELPYLPEIERSPHRAYSRSPLYPPTLWRQTLGLRLKRIGA